MKISLEWLTEFGLDIQEFSKEPQKLADLLTNAGLEVEEIVDQAKDFKNVVVAEILEKNKHQNSDNLTLCIVSTGNQKHHIVCGAKNHKAGDKVVLALPGAVLPGNFAIKVSKIRGEESQGMLCSEKELGLASESEGIMILPPDAQGGTPFSAYSGKQNIIFEIKITPNRTDCLSHFGIVREIAALTGKNFEFPITPFTEGRESTRKLIKVIVDDPERCPRYAGRVIKNVKVKPSPPWLKTRLESVGLRSINNVVDITNYVMLGMGQPLHAFDLEKLDGPQIIVRGATVGEKLVTLDKKEITFDGTELLICDAKKPVAIAGVMGGFESGVTDRTRDVFLESAFFLPATVRRASRRHGIESDSSYRFSRGVDPESVLLGLNRACQLLSEIADGVVCADSYDFYPRPLSRPRIELNLKFISDRLGIPVEVAESKRILERTGATVSGSGDKLLVNPPAFRSDLKFAEDLGEEILRYKGFLSIPETVPQLSAAPTDDVARYSLEFRLAQTMSSLGASQSVNLNITSSHNETEFLSAKNRGDVKEQGINYSLEPVKIKNPLNQELDILRQSLLPSLAKNVAYNIRHGNTAGNLFEIAPSFQKREVDDLQGQKRPYYEESHLGLFMWGDEQVSWIKKSAIPIFFRLKGVIETFLVAWGYKSFRFDAMKNPPAFCHPGQCARIFVEGKTVGLIGVLHPFLDDKLEIKVPAALAELNLDLLFAGQPREIKAKPLFKFPRVDRDVALLVPTATTSEQVKQELLKAGGDLVVACQLFDLYEGEKLPLDKKSLAFRLTYQDRARTLSDEEVNALHQKAVETTCAKLGVSTR